MKHRVIFLVVAILGAMLIVIPDAKACSCAPTDPRDEFNFSDGAFIGQYIGREPADASDPFGDYDYIFETETVYKGDIGETVEIRASENGASCGLEYPEGARAALFAYLEEGVWRSDLCRTVEPSALEEAASPLPAPDAEGPPVLLVGGSFGEVRVIALDEKGRTAGYGYGEGDAMFMSLCPGRQRTVEMVGGWRNEESRFVDVRRISDLEVVSTTPAPAKWRDTFAFPHDAECISQDGDTAVFSRGYEDESFFSELRLFAGGQTSLLLRSRAKEAALGAREAFLAKGGRIQSVDYDNGAPSLFRRGDQKFSHLALTPNGDYLAAIEGASTESGKLLVIRTTDGKVTARRDLQKQSEFAHVEWVSNEKLLVSGLSQTAHIYDRSLSPTAELNNWFAQSNAAIGCKLFGAGYGAVAEVSGCSGGEAELTRVFFSPVVNALLKLPKGTEITAPPRSN